MRAALAYRKFERCKYTVFFLNAKQFSYFSANIAIFLSIKLRCLK